MKGSTRIWVRWLNNQGLAELVALLASRHTSAAAAQDGLGDPAGSDPIVGAVQWLQGTLLGTVATVVAVIATQSLDS